MTFLRQKGVSDHHEWGEINGRAVWAQTGGWVQQGPFPKDSCWFLSASNMVSVVEDLGSTSQQTSWATTPVVI